MGNEEQPTWGRGNRGRRAGPGGATTQSDMSAGPASIGAGRRFGVQVGPVLADRTGMADPNLPRGERRLRGDRGASLVEFALVLPVLISLVFGILDFGIVYSNQISFRNGVREGARMGVVDNLNTACQSGDLGSFTGTAPSTRMQNLMCATKNQIGLTPKSNVKVMLVFDSTYAQYQGLIVCAMTPVTSKTGLFSTLLNGKYLKSKVEMTIEKTNTTTQTAGAEALPWTGSEANWTWCNATTPSP